MYELDKEMWHKLISIYEGDGKVKKENLQTFRRQFESINMKDEEKIVAYLVNSLRGLREEVKENEIVQKVLRSLPNCFDAKVCAIEELKDLDTLSMDELHGILITYQMRSRNPAHTEAAFKASK